jgi:hypothetical protein
MSEKYGVFPRYSKFSVVTRGKVKPRVLWSKIKIYSNDLKYVQTNTILNIFMEK